MATFYAYYLINEGLTGIVDSWNECQSLTKGKNARFKKFTNIDSANEWLESGANYDVNNNPKKQKKSKNHSLLDENAIYFDSGTGRKGTSEVKVSDISGSSLLPIIMPSNKINEFGNYYLGENRTNNFGELTALFIALKIAKINNATTICGDSKLVIEYWSKGLFNKNNIDEDTINLISKVTKLRKEFENKGGKVIHISGDVNPADLGFHK